MPLIIDTGPRIYLEIDNFSDCEITAHFTWDTMDMEQFVIKHEQENRAIHIEGNEVFTFDHNCNNIYVVITRGAEEIFQAQLESYTVSRTYRVEGANGTYTCSSHEN